jgi:uncharacterized protein YqhQ
MKKTSIGGQAVIEGVMMRGPQDIAIAVRKPDKEITIDKRAVKPLTARYKVLNIPIIRGVIAFFESMIIGMKSLMFSAEFYDLEDGEDSEPTKFDKFLENIFGDKLQSALIYFSVVISLFLGIGLFMIFPTIIAGFIRKLIPSTTLANIAEGIFRIAIFLGYIIIISGLKDIQRVFQYHGAEHKAIFCYENDEELTIDNIKKYSRFHPRCGTNFIFLVMIVSIMVFSFISWDNLVTRMVMRLSLLPLVAGLSYEVIKLAGKSNHPLVKLISKPGIMLQRFTTREPDDSQIEVAVEALKNVISDECKVETSEG